jgi:hypothetical protein
MAKIKIRYFVAKKGKGGRVKYFWQPAKSLRAQGWAPVRLADELAAAMSEAETINARLDAWRAGGLPAATQQTSAGAAAIGGGESADAPEIDRAPAVKALAGVQAAPERGAAAPAGTIEAVSREWRQSARYRATAAGTKRAYESALKSVLADMGDIQAAALTAPLLDRYYEREHKRAPVMANLKFAVLKMILSFAARTGEIPANPAREIRTIGTPRRQEVWTDRALSTMVEAADAIGRPSVGTALLMLAYLLQRKGDTLRLSWADYSAGALRLRQKKTGRPVEIPAAGELKARLETARARARAGKAPELGAILVNENTGQPYSETAFADAFRLVKAEAIKRAPELDGLRVQDLRRTGVVWMAEEGATEAQIAAVTGHNIETTRQILETYLPRNSVMAAAGVAKLADRRGRAAKRAAGEES